MAEKHVHGVARQSDWLMLNGWVLGAVVLAGAGLFQYSRLEYYCLDRCRTPLGFIAQHWRGTAPLRRALRLNAAIAQQPEVPHRRIGEQHALDPDALGIVELDQPWPRQAVACRNIGKPRIRS